MHPDERKRIEGDISKFGWHAVGVFDPDEKHEEFTFTIGLRDTFDHPEIAIFGLPNQTAHSILSAIVHDLREGQRFELSVPAVGFLSNDIPMVFRRAKTSCHNEYFGTAAGFYKEPFEVWVAFWPDRESSFPWESAYSAGLQLEALEIVEP